MKPQAKKKRSRDTSRRLLEESNLLIIRFSGFDYLRAYHPNLLKNRIKNYRKLVINYAADFFQPSFSFAKLILHA